MWEDNAGWTFWKHQNDQLWTILARINGLLKRLILQGRWMLESDWLTNVLFSGKRTANVVPGSSRPHYNSVSLRQMISVISHKVLQQQYNQSQQDQTHKYSKQWDKNDISLPRFSTKLCFIMYVKGKVLPLSLPQCEFDIIHALSISLFLSLSLIT